MKLNTLPRVIVEKLNKTPLRRFKALKKGLQKQREAALRIQTSIRRIA